jgi:sulfate adenylyltransferase subunit 2
MTKHLKQLESESIFIFREVWAEFKNPVMLYSVGKDSSVMVRLAQKAFYPNKIPFPLMHIDTGYKFPEMYEFRDNFVKDIGANLIIHKNEEWLDKAHPLKLGTDKCCKRLKTEALLQGIETNDFDAAFGGARRDEEKSRAKERIFSVRDRFGQWHPKSQRPELWNLFNGEISEDETVRVFPLSNWTEKDVWHYIREENIPIVPLYYAQERNVVDRKGVLIPVDYPAALVNPDEKVEKMSCRFRSLGCIPCTGAVRSEADTIDKIIEEVESAKKSERENRVIDLGSESSMEDKKKAGYF